ADGFGLEGALRRSVRRGGTVCRFTPGKGGGSPVRDLISIRRWRSGAPQAGEQTAGKPREDYGLYGRSQGDVTSGDSELPPTSPVRASEKTQCLPHVPA